MNTHSQSLHCSIIVYCYRICGLSSQAWYLGRWPMEMIRIIIIWSQSRPRCFSTCIMLLMLYCYTTLDFCLVSQLKGWVNQPPVILTWNYVSLLHSHRLVQHVRWLSVLLITSGPCMLWLMRHWIWQSAAWQPIVWIFSLQNTIYQADRSGSPEMNTNCKTWIARR